MARSSLYPEGSTTVNMVVPTTVKTRLRDVAIKRRLSMSAVATAIFEDWLRRNTTDQPNLGALSGGESTSRS